MPIFPMSGGVTCAFLNVDKLFILLLNVALTISKFYLTLQIGKFLLINKALNVVANSFKAFKATLLRGFFYTHNLITC